MFCFLYMRVWLLYVCLSREIISRDKVNFLATLLALPSRGVRALLRILTRMRGSAVTVLPTLNEVQFILKPPPPFLSSLHTQSGAR